MTKKEAIYILRNAAWLGSDADRQKVEEAVEVVAKAIEVLNHSEIPNSFGKDTNVPSNDTISRQDAIDAVKKHYRAHDNDLLELIAFDIKRLPSAQPEQAVKDCRNCKHGKYNDYHDTYFCYNAEDCSNWDKWETSEQPESCEGCKNIGLWENEVEYGYSSPCTRCKRRVSDNYER